jgi:hypothetical protein
MDRTNSRRCLALDVELLVDGKDVPLNSFTQKIIGNVLAGVVESLKDVDPNWKKIVVELEQ